MLGMLLNSHILSNTIIRFAVTDVQFNLTTAPILLPEAQ
jgi:hypothetical protein